MHPRLPKACRHTVYMPWTPRPRLHVQARAHAPDCVLYSSETAPIELKTRPTLNSTRFKGFCTEIQGFCTFGCKSPGFRCKNLWKSFGIWIPNPGFLHRNPGFLRFWAQRPWISAQKPRIPSIFSLKNLVKFQVGQVLSSIGAVPLDCG